MIKVLVGQRRVGKSYLIRQIIDELIKSKVNPKNIIYLHFRSLGYKVYVGKIGQQEIDFVIEKDTRKYIQVAFSLSDKKVVDREFGNLEIIPDNYEKMVINLDDVSFGNRNGIQHKPAWEV